MSVTGLKLLAIGLRILSNIIGLIALFFAVGAVPFFVCTFVNEGTVSIWWLALPIVTALLMVALFLKHRTDFLGATSRKILAIGAFSVGLMFFLVPAYLLINGKSLGNGWNLRNLVRFVLGVLGGTTLLHIGWQWFWNYGPELDDLPINFNSAEFSLAEQMAKHHLQDFVANCGQPGTLSTIKIWDPTQENTNVPLWLRVLEVEGEHFRTTPTLAPDSEPEEIWTTRFDEVLDWLTLKPGERLRGYFWRIAALAQVKARGLQWSRTMDEEAAALADYETYREPFEATAKEALKS